MAKTKRKTAVAELDSVYFLKIILFFIIGSIWLHFTSGNFLPGISNVPIGFLIGLIFARHDHFMIDRKIEYVVLLAACLISYIAPVGVVVSV